MELQQEEIEHYEVLLAETMEELESLRAQVNRNASTQEYLDGALYDFEEENQKQLQELRELREFQAQSVREMEKRQKDASTAIARSLGGGGGMTKQKEKNKRRRRGR